MSKEKTLSIWKHNRRSGMWDHQRGVTPETKDEWMKVYQKDEPDAHFHVSTKKPKHNPTMKEEMNVGAIAGSGDARLAPDQREPGVKTRMFAGNKAFVFKRQQFLEFQNLSKKDRKWWKSYLGKNEDYIAPVREYAKKNPKSPIIFEDEDTGYLFYAKYGKK